MATLTSLPLPQWRLMNVAYHQRPGELATLLLRACDAEPSDLITLAEGGMVRLVGTGGRPVDPAAVAADPGVLTHFKVRVGSTSTGLRWVVENPANCVLHVGAARDRGAGVPVRDIRSATGADMHLLVELADAGLIEILTGERGDTPIRLRPGPVSEMWRLKVTRKGRSLLAA